MGLQSTAMRRGILTVVMIGAGLLLVIIISVSGFSSGSGESNKVYAGELYEVVEGSFVVSVPASGELAAKDQINIHNLLESNAVIIELVDEGSIVSSGDVLVRFVLLHYQGYRTRLLDNFRWHLHQISNHRY